jgi:hypothetical protein
MRPAALLLVAASALASATAGHAAAAQDESGPARDAPETTWYGWQIMLTDAAAVASFAAIGSAGSDAAARDLAIAGALAYLGGGPIVHGVHDRGVEAGESFLLRLGLPFGLALTGDLVALGLNGACSGSQCAIQPSSMAIGGLLVGAIGASAIDIVALAHAPVPRKACTTASLTLRPTAYVTPQAGHSPVPTLAMMGSF